MYFENFNQENEELKGSFQSECKQLLIVWSLFSL
jgi:hypothetical protein